MKLNELYELKRKKFNLEGIKENPSKLLSILLLQNIDNFVCNQNDELDDFYNKNKILINLLIEKVIKDFNFNSNELIDIIEESKNCDNFENDVIWCVFLKGFSSVYWALKCDEKYTPEQVYSIYFNDYSLYNTGNKVIAIVSNPSRGRERLKRILEDNNEFFSLICESMNPTERMEVLENLENKSCETCTNGSCSVPTCEKYELDAGRECFGWYNAVYIGQSKFYNERDILKLKYKN